MNRQFLLRPSTWLGTFALCSLAIFWRFSVHRIDLMTWTIGPGRSGDRLVQFAISQGIASLFWGETGLSREPGFHYDSRIFAADEERGPWFPKFLSIESSLSGLNIEVAVWFLLVVCASSWLLWSAWRRVRIRRAQEREQAVNDNAD
jgi:hypothetical protein